MPNLVVLSNDHEEDGINLPSIPSTDLKFIIELLDCLDKEIPLIPSSGKPVLQTMTHLFTGDYLGLAPEIIRLLIDEVFHSLEFTSFLSVRTKCFYMLEGIVKPDSISLRQLASAYLEGENFISIKDEIYDRTFRYAYEEYTLERLESAKKQRESQTFLFDEELNYFEKEWAAVFEDSETEMKATKFM